MNITVAELERLYRRANVAEHSLQASLSGYVAGAVVLVTHYIPGISPFRYFGEGLGMYLFELIFSLFFSVLGWLMFILPVTSNYRPGRWIDRVWMVAPLGGLIGAAVLLPLDPLFLESGRDPSGIPMAYVYEISAFVNAATASGVCVYLGRRSQRRFEAWRLRQAACE